MQNAVVLVVDDDDSIREALMEWVRHFGGTPIQAASGRDALQLLRDHPRVEVVLSDLNMPGGDGLELFHGARALMDERGIVFVWLCGTMGEDQLRLIQDTGRPHFPKPFSMPPVMQYIQTALAERRSRPRPLPVFAS